MILLLHISVALLGLLSATYLYFKPSRTLLRFSYFLATSTLISGSALLINKPTHHLQACLTGVFYLGVVSVGIVSARRKLAQAVSK